MAPEDGVRSGTDTILRSNVPPLSQDPAVSSASTAPYTAKSHVSLVAPKDGTISMRLQQADVTTESTADSSMSDATSPRLVSGDLIGHYRVLDVLGSGAMGYLHRARDERLERDVAIKLAFDSAATDSEAILREARALAALNHPNVVTVYEVGTHHECTYIVMELLRGETLRARLDRAPISLIDALTWACDVIRGLSASHAANILHLDVKPDNIFLTKEGAAKLIDFGVAREKRTGSFESGNIVGTIAYMAPEQLLGDKLDYRADIFAFGVVLHELVTGKHPFMRAHLSATMHALVTGDFFQEGHLIDPMLDAIVRKCMRLEATERPASAADVLEDLERVLRGRTQVISRHTQIAYVETNRGNVAYQCAGTPSTLDVLVVPGLLSRFDAWTHDQEGASFLRTLTNAARIVLFDHVGLGASDRIHDAAPPSVDEEIDHIDAVLDAAGCSRVVLLALDTGAPLAALYAAIRPDRVAGLVVYGGAPHYADADVQTALSKRADGWGTEANAPLWAPSISGKTHIVQWIATWERMTASPRVARTWIGRLERTDVTAVLPFITCRTLVLQQQDNPFCASSQSLLFVQGIADATHVVLPVTDHWICTGAQDVATHVVQFVQACARGPARDKDHSLATWLLTNAPVETIPTSLHPDVVLEQGGSRLIRVDRPGAAYRGLDSVLRSDVKTVLACTASSALAADVFTEMQKSWADAPLGVCMAVSSARSILDGTLSPWVEKPAASTTQRPSISPHSKTSPIEVITAPTNNVPSKPERRGGLVMASIGFVVLVVGLGWYSIRNKQNDSRVSPPVVPSTDQLPHKSAYVQSLDSQPAPISKIEPPPVASVSAAPETSTYAGKRVIGPKVRPSATTPNETTTPTPPSTKKLDIKLER